MDFSAFDRRNYPSVSPKVGYAEWSTTYEASVPDLLDISVLERITSVAWSETRQCLDLACGTGRIGSWLAKKGVSTIDGVDLTPEMLAQAKGKGVYRTLLESSVESTDLPGDQYDLLVMCLVDEHLSALTQTYSEAFRCSAPGARFVVVGMHPFFFMNGMPTHFDSKDRGPQAIETHVHLFSDHFNAAKSAGWALQEVIEGIIDAPWIRAKPKWERFRNFPVNYGYVWSQS